jgi:hypothetical protein
VRRCRVAHDRPQCGLIGRLEHGIVYCRSRGSRRRSRRGGS